MAQKENRVTIHFAIFIRVIRAIIGWWSFQEITLIVDPPAALRGRRAAGMNHI